VWTEKTTLYSTYLHSEIIHSTNQRMQNTSQSEHNIANTNMWSVISGSLSEWHGACSRWRNALHIWRVAANILNKQPQTANSNVSPALGLDKVLLAPHCKHLQCYETFHMALYLNWSFDAMQAVEKEHDIIILKWIFKKGDGEARTGLIWLRTGTGGRYWWMQ
jgi:hypothetical protein